MEIDGKIRQQRSPDTIIAIQLLIHYFSHTRVLSSTQANGSWEKASMSDLLTAADRGALTPTDAVHHSASASYLCFRDVQLLYAQPPLPHQEDGDGDVVMAPVEREWAALRDDAAYAKVCYCGAASIDSLTHASMSVGGCWPCLCRCCAAAVFDALLTAHERLHTMQCAVRVTGTGRRVWRGRDGRSAAVIRAWRPERRHGRGRTCVCVKHAYETTSACTVIITSARTTIIPPLYP